MSLEGLGIVGWALIPGKVLAKFLMNEAGDSRPLVRWVFLVDIIFENKRASARQ